MKAALLLSTMAVLAAAQEPQAPPAATRQPNMNDRMRSFFGLGPPPDRAAVERGQQLFVASCGFCHGTNATGGNSGPDLVRSVLVLHDEGSGSQIGPVILSGRPAKGMPKFPMTDAQVKDIAAFLLSRSQAAANRMTYKILNVVTGDPKAGEAYFRGHCSICHSATGDLTHVAGKYDATTLQSRFLYPLTRTYPGMPGPRVSEKAQTTATVTLSSGQSFSGVLKDIDDFGVALVDSSGEYHAWPIDQDSIKVELHDPLRGHEELLKQYSDADMHNILAYLETLK